MANDPLKRTRNERTTEETESSSEDASLQPAEGSATQPAKVSSAGSQPLASRTIKVGN